MRVVTLNLNGIRAAFRRGVAGWLETAAPDFLCVQEVRARETALTAEMRAPAGLAGVFAPAARPGYSGVGIYGRAGAPPGGVTRRFGDAVMDEEGRFVRLNYPRLSVVSLYLPSGSSGEARQAVKMAVMARVARRMARWMREAKRGGRECVVCADWNIAHTRRDICNWRGNQKNSGFLPEERAWVTALLEAGWVDVFRRLDGEEGGYTWWSNRGRAYANNVGWRIDYQLATPGLAARARRAEVYKAVRFSDHAPLVIDYDWEGD